MIELIIYVSSIIFLTTIGLIIILLLKELGILLYIVESLYTHPYFDKIMVVMSSVIFGISIGVVGSAGYAYITTSAMPIKAIVYGTIGIVIGTILKELFKKD